MGFFDRFKGEYTAGRPGGSSGRPAQPSVLDEIAKAYGLKEKEPDEPSIEGTWLEGEAGTTRFAVQENAGRLFVHIGTIAEITDIYLGRASAKQPLPPDGSPGRIDRIVKDHPIAKQFFLLAYPREGFDLPQLRLPGVSDALARLSPLVDEVMIYDTYAGVTLVLPSAVARADFDRDLAAGVELAKALSGDK